jgi:hypothetical protein
MLNPTANASIAAFASHANQLQKARGFCCSFVSACPHFPPPTSPSPTGTTTNIPSSPSPSQAIGPHLSFWLAFEALLVAWRRIRIASRKQVQLSNRAPFLAHPGPRPVSTLLLIHLELAVTLEILCTVETASRKGGSDSKDTAKYHESTHAGNVILKG